MNCCGEGTKPHALDAQPKAKPVRGIPPTAPCSMAQVTASGWPSSSRIGDHGADPEAEVGGLAAPELHRGTAGDDLFDAVLGQGEAGPGAHDLARDGGVVWRFAGLFLVRVKNDEVDQMARDADVVGAEGPGGSQAGDLCDYKAAVVAGGDGLFQAAEVGAFVFVGEVAVFHPRWWPEGCRRQPGCSGSEARSRLRTRHASLWAELPRARSSHSLRGLDQQRFPCPPWSIRRAGARRPRGACRIGCPKGRYRRRRGPRRSSSRSRALAGWMSRKGRTGKDARQQPVLRDPVHPLDAVHVAGCNGV